MLKKIIDIFGSAAGLLILSPVLLALAILIRRQMGAPVLFRQIRPGRGAKPFEMLKFRSMLDTTNTTGQPLSDTDRLTPFGKKLRATSLDELPSLWNVLKGEMSLVGPRPLLMEYVSLYSPQQARRMEVRPGITGWAQINGRNALSWNEKFALDVWYVDNRTIWLDLKILALTIRKVLASDGITTAEGSMMPPFRGASQNARNDEEQQS